MSPLISIGKLIRAGMRDENKRNNIDRNINEIF